MTLVNMSAVEAASSSGAQRNSGQIWWDQAESLQDLDSVVGRTFQENAAVGKTGILPLLSAAAKPKALG